MPKQRRLRIPRKRYYVDDIQLMLRLEEIELLRNHLTSMGLTSSMSPAQLKATLANHTLILRHLNEKIKAAKAYYNIVSDSKPTPTNHALSSQRNPN